MYSRKQFIILLVANQNFKNSFQNCEYIQFFNDLQKNNR